MELQLKYKGNDYAKIKEMVIKAHNEVGLRLKNKLENLIVCVNKNRKEFDKKLNRKTKLWEVANVTNGEINILNFNSFVKESTHKADEFFSILKHEIAHLFIDRMTNDKTIPKWLDEGLAQYVSGKYKDIKHSICIEEDFCEKLGTSKGWLDKIMELLSKLDRNYYYPNFEATFKNFFGKTLKDLEKEFVDKIK